MCFANATLFYGLWVTTASLNFAAAAHQATRDPVLAIDLIVARRRAGKLEAEGQGARTTARELPEEVWDMVKHALLGAAVKQAEKETLNELRCTECEQDPQTGPGRLTLEERDDWSSWSHAYCDETLSAIGNSGLTWLRFKPLLQDVEDLFRYYGLILPSEGMWHDDPSEYYADFDSLSAIALPARSTHEDTTKVVVECEHDTLSSSSTTMRLVHGHFDLPTLARLRFRRLIRDYRLHVVDRTTQTIFPPELVNSLAEKTSPSLGAEAGSVGKVTKEEEEVKPSRFAEEEPRWMLWSLCEPCT